MSDNGEQDICEMLEKKVEGLASTYGASMTACWRNGNDFEFMLNCPKIECEHIDKKGAVTKVVVEPFIMVTGSLNDIVYILRVSVKFRSSNGVLDSIFMRSKEVSFKEIGQMGGIDEKGPEDMIDRMASEIENRLKDVRSI